MQLASLLPLIEKHLDRLLLSEGGQRRVRVLDTAKPALLAALAHKSRTPMAVITSSPRCMSELVAPLSVWLGDEARVLPFPEPDVSPYEPIPIDKNVTWQRLSALSALLDSQDSGDGRGVVVVTTVRSLMYYTIDAGYLKEVAHEIKAG